MAVATAITADRRPMCLAQRLAHDGAWRWPSATRGHGQVGLRPADRARCAPGPRSGQRAGLGPRDRSGGPPGPDLLPGRRPLCVRVTTCTRRSWRAGAWCAAGLAAWSCAARAVPACTVARVHGGLVRRGRVPVAGARQTARSRASRATARGRSAAWSVARATQNWAGRGRRAAERWLPGRRPAAAGLAAEAAAGAAARHRAGAMPAPASAGGPGVGQGLAPAGERSRLAAGAT